MKYTKEQFLAEIARIVPGVEQARRLGPSIPLRQMALIAAEAAFIHKIESEILRAALIDLEVNGCFNFTE